MTAVVPGGRRSLLGQVAAAVAGLRGRPAGRLAALAAVARQHVVTAAALASVDFGAFRASGAAGWIVSGVSALVLDFAVRG